MFIILTFSSWSLRKQPYTAENNGRLRNSAMDDSAESMRETCLDLDVQRAGLHLVSSVAKQTLASEDSKG